VIVNPLIDGEVARTAEPDPVTALTVVPLILKTFPAPAVSNVLFVKVSVVAFPINVLNAVKMCQEVCTVFCATANPVEVILAQSEQGRGVLGVIDGFSPKGVEKEDGIAWRKDLLIFISFFISSIKGGQGCTTASGKGLREGGIRIQRRGGEATSSSSAISAWKYAKEGEVFTVEFILMSQTFRRRCKGKTLPFFGRQQRGSAWISAISRSRWRPTPMTSSAA
jgi:hypothetical protein